MIDSICGHKGLRLALAGAVLGLFATPAFSEAGDDDNASRIQRGFELTPVPVQLAGKNRAQVGLGAYFVNSMGCNDCHTHPSFAPGGNPYAGQPEIINVDQFLTGGRQFGPFITSPNLTPDASGKPAGLTRAEFIQTIRTGHNPHDPPGAILQVMPWPAFRNLNDGDLSAIYAYLSAIASKPDNPSPGP